jgi:hypothetical protein
MLSGLPLVACVLLLLGSVGLVNGVKYAGEEFAHLADNWNQRPYELTKRKT